ncbi:hypothetical protein OQ496_13430 [Acetobacter suratthaniensis]|nr:hypothetical protein [Acetobacter suratthaniensis]MCX2567449.1 hypothetical protein [Acetobacter suratthaniensis]
MARLRLSANRATRQHDDLGSSTSMELLGNFYPAQDIVATRLDQIRSAVIEYGARVAADRPQESFMVMITVPRGQRRPAGFEAAYREGSLGTNDWMHEIFKRPLPMPDDYGVRMWGGPHTPFQFADHGSLWPDETPDEFTSPAAGHIGLYGWLRATNARVQRLSQCTHTLLDVATVAELRAAYAARRHPLSVAQDALRASPQALAA